MKILILNWRDPKHPKSGGAEAVTLRHAAGWVKEGHSVEWWTSTFSGSGKKDTIEGVLIRRIAPTFFLHGAVAIQLLCQSSSFDVIVDEFHGIPFFSPLWTKKPVIVFIHEIAGIIWDYMYPFPLNVIGKTIEKISFRIYRKCTFWTDAPSTIEELVEIGVPKGQCIAIPCPIPHTPDSRLQNQKKESNPTYIFVSRIVRMKGIEDVIQAFRIIHQKQPKSRLWIVGDGDEHYIHSIKNLINSFGLEKAVIFWGYVLEIKKYELMSRAHILLHASVKEGWGLVALEAAAVGTPSVVYNVSGLRDVVQNEKTGIVLKLNHPELLANEALSLIHNKQKYIQLQKNGILWEKGILWRNIISESMELLLSKRRSLIA